MWLDATRNQSQWDTAAGRHMASKQGGVGTEDVNLCPHSELTFPLCPVEIRLLD